MKQTLFAIVPTFILLAACAPAPTATPLPTATALLIPTATALPTSTPTMTPTPTDTPTPTATAITALTPSATPTRIATAAPTPFENSLGTGPETNNIYSVAGGLAANEAYIATIDAQTGDKGTTIVVGVKVETAYIDPSTGHTIGQFVFVGQDGKTVYRFKCDTFAVGNDRSEKSIFVGNVPPDNPGFVTLENLAPNTLLRMNFYNDDFQRILSLAMSHFRCRAWRECFYVQYGTPVSLVDREDLLLCVNLTLPN